jgi:K+-transporting ATPase ATPase A chain
LQFVSAGTGIAALAALFRALALKSGNNLGNFYSDLVKSCTRILLPLSVVVAIFLMINGSPSTFHGAKEVISMQGDTVKVATGPAASMVAIKQLGTNGGGYFGPNSAHPFENPNFLTNAVEAISIILIPIAMVFAFGYYLKKKKVAWVIFTVMLIGYLALLAPTLSSENGGNTALWSISTTVTSNGSANSMHDSFMPISGMCMLLGMQLNSFFGGVGVGFINMFVFIIVAVFISGLMVGRTPEFLGKKIEAKEVKIAIIVALLHPLLILSGVAIGSHIWATTANPSDSLKWLGNPGYHGFSEMLYTVTSASANNGSEFGGLNGNLPFWNILDGIVMIIGRFIPIIGPLAIAGAFAAKKEVPESSGTLRTDSLMFGVVLFSVIVILGALLFFPALALGPISEALSL